VKRERLLLIACLVLTPGFLVQLVASPADDIAARIKPVGEVCVEGKDCTAATSVDTAAASAESPAATASVSDTFSKTCATCHTAGVAGAPRLGNKEDWAPRIAKGKDALYLSAINGLAPAMPAKGMCFTCSDDELKALVDYMIESNP
jgi:cytochrome c5